jgi:hypothetical protein
MFRRAALAVAFLVGSVLWAAPPATLAAPSPQSGPTYRGDATGVYGPFHLGAGPVVLRGHSDGASNFVVSLVRPEPGQSPDDAAAWSALMFDAIGTFDGAAAEIAPEAGSYYLLVTLSSGPYQMTVEQPTASSATPTDQVSFSGKQQQVPAAFTLKAGTATIAAQKDANDSLEVSLYRLTEYGGASITDENYGHVIDSDLTDLSVTIPVPADGVYLMYVDAEGSGSLQWTVSVQQPTQ